MHVVLGMEVSDQRFTKWMRGNLEHAAAELSLTITGPPVFGWRLRSIGAPAAAPSGVRRWLRVVTEYPRWASGHGWTGNHDAHTITGIARPVVTEIIEWDDDGRRQRAEAMTLLTGKVVSLTAVAERPFELPDQWWTALRRALDRLAEIPTGRVHIEPDTVAARATDRYGGAVPVKRWQTVHGDLHWANLMIPRFGLLDWELWGRGPMGTDAASLLCHSLLVPALADRVHSLFADVLDTPEGRTAQLVVGARLLGRIASGDYPDLAGPLRRHLATLNQPAHGT